MIRLDTDRATLRRFASDLMATRDGREAPPGPDLAAFDADTVEIARLGWAARVVDEYRSVVVFSDLLHRLADLEAPFPVLCTMHQLVGDELRHTRACFTVVEWLGGFGDLDIDLDGLGVAVDDAPSAARVLEIVAREIVVAETESVRVLAAYRDATSEPAIRGVLDDLLRDEVRHAAAGRELHTVLESFLPAAQTASVREKLPAVMAAERLRLRAEYAALAVGGPGRALGVSILPGDLA